MTHWFDDLPGVTGALPLDQGLLAAWPDRAMEARLCHLRHCPVLPQELYQIARHLPLVVVDQPGGPLVMAELAPGRLRRPAFDAEGRYLRSYRPLVSRLLPFCAAPGGELLRLTDPGAPAGPDRPEDLRRQIVQMLRAQAAGLTRMAEAAQILVEEGLLVRGSDPAMPEWVPPPEDLAAETAGAAANLPPVPASFLALRLLAVLEFSALHRRETQARRSDADSLRELLGRNEALRRQTFLIRDDLLDFSAFAPPAPAAAAEEQTETDPQAD
ncbi:hypothetical protein D2N39_18615 [Gemmobacter lutimaris]|uniref:SapC family protein n=1 Tax=Gemmobacter lutimaris TaxID=2306023 RepID=A0A398BPA6_9RHOB|nr:hypothetical protein [Gemmobacter lutimaris]RID90378.1 hypothetical protein D2N39_18615 [Gemmobacter lutimaris]